MLFNIFARVRFALCMQRTNKLLFVPLALLGRWVGGWILHKRPLLLAVFFLSCQTTEYLRNSKSTYYLLNWLEMREI
jgi:hypothetical protein